MDWDEFVVEEKKYMSTDDVPDVGEVVTVTECGREEMANRKAEQDPRAPAYVTKLVLHFAEKTPGFVCNRTQTRALQRIVAPSPDTDALIGRQIILRRVPLPQAYNGHSHTVEIVAVPSSLPAAPPPSAPTAAPVPR